jgi:glucose-6-phosphate-specific signal transduction histidine kinase
MKNEIHQRELLSTQLEIQQATMQQIGRELHDNIGKTDPGKFVCSANAL